MLRDEDVEKLLIMICPETWDPIYEKDGKDEHRKGLLSMKMAEGAKLQMCYLLHHLCDIQLRHRVESIIAFSHDFVGDLQTDQLRRYIDIKQSDLPSAMAAKKTKEFRCPPREQMNAILCKFKIAAGKFEQIDRRICVLTINQDFVCIHVSPETNITVLLSNNKIQMKYVLKLF